MTPNKKDVKRASGIKLTRVRAETIVPATVDFGALGSGEFQFRPLLYNDRFRQNLDEAMEKLVASGDESAAALDSIQRYLLPLIAGWDIQAPLEDIVAVEEIDTGDEDVYNNFVQSLGEPTFDEESGMDLYKLPVSLKAMRLFPALGNSSGMDAILKAVASIDMGFTSRTTVQK